MRPRGTGSRPSAQAMPRAMKPIIPIASTRRPRCRARGRPGSHVVQPDQMLKTPSARHREIGDDDEDATTRHPEEGRGDAQPSTAGWSAPTPTAKAAALSRDGDVGDAVGRVLEALEPVVAVTTRDRPGRCSTVRQTDEPRRSPDATGWARRRSRRRRSRTGRRSSKHGLVGRVCCAHPRRSAGRPTAIGHVEDDRRGKADPRTGADHRVRLAPSRRRRRGARLGEGPDGLAAVLVGLVAATSATCSARSIDRLERSTSARARPVVRERQGWSRTDDPTPGTSRVRGRAESHLTVAGVEALPGIRDLSRASRHHPSHGPSGRQRRRRAEGVGFEPTMTLPP